MLRSNRGRRSGLWFATALALWLTAWVGYRLMARLHTDSVQTLEHSLDAWQAPLTLLRWGVIVIIAVSWHPVLDALAKKDVLLQSHADWLRSLSGRAVAWLVVLELVLGQGVLVKTLAWLLRG